MIRTVFRKSPSRRLCKKVAATMALSSLIIPHVLQNVIAGVETTLSTKTARNETGVDKKDASLIAHAG